MAAISLKPATNVQEAIQATYFGYLCAVKEQNGAAMSLGRTSTFLDCYAQRDLKNGTFTEEQIQEFVDHFIMKLRLIKFARTHGIQPDLRWRSCMGKQSLSAVLALTDVLSLQRCPSVT